MNSVEDHAMFGSAGCYSQCGGPHADLEHWAIPLSASTASLLRSDGQIGLARGDLCVRALGSSNHALSCSRKSELVRDPAAELRALDRDWLGAYSARACLPGAAADNNSSRTEWGKQHGWSDVLLIAVLLLVACLLLAHASRLGGSAAPDWRRNGIVNDWGRDVGCRDAGWGGKGHIRALHGLGNPNRSRVGTSERGRGRGGAGSAGGRGGTRA